jgi:hypothetical protein
MDDSPPGAITRHSFTSATAVPHGLPGGSRLLPTCCPRPRPAAPEPRSRVPRPGLACAVGWWAWQVLNLRPLPCERMPPGSRPTPPPHSGLQQPSSPAMRRCMAWDRVSCRRVLLLAICWQPTPSGVLCRDGRSPVCTARSVRVDSRVVGGFGGLLFPACSDDFPRY